MYDYNKKVVWKEIDETKLTPGDKINGFGGYTGGPVVWEEIDETKLSPEDIEKQKRFELYYQYMKGAISSDEIYFFSMLGMSTDEILQKIENKEKVVWNWEK